jgi:nitroreductase
MDTIEMLKNRRSCRAFKKEQIKDGELQTVLDCGLAAPAAMNLQEVKIIVVQDPEKLAEISRLNAQIMGSKSDPLYGAPTACLVVAPKNDNGNATMDLNPIKDGSLVIGAMQNAAWALGLGSCWINRLQEMFELPEGKAILHSLGLDGYLGIGICILGYPAKEQAGPRKTKEGRVLKY